MYVCVWGGEGCMCMCVKDMWKYKYKMLSEKENSF